MKYRITVQETKERINSDGRRYEDSETIYTQTVENLDLKALVVVVNQIPSVFQISDDKAEGEEKDASEHKAPAAPDSPGGAGTE